MTNPFKIIQSNSKITRITPKEKPFKLISLWMSKIFWEFHQPNKTFGGRGELSIDDDILHELGFSDWINEEIPEAAFKQRIRQNLESLTRSEITICRHLAINIQRLKERLTLSDTDCMIMIIAIENYRNEGFNNLLEECRGWSEQKLVRSFAKLFNISRADVATSLKSNSLLRRIGILTGSRHKFGRSSSLADHLSIIEGLPEVLLDSLSTSESLFENYVIETTPTTLIAKDFDHIKSEYDQLVRYVKNARKQKISSANILMYGPPGVGKTELVKVISQKLKLPLFEVSMRDEEGDALNGGQRFSAYQLGQRLLESNHKAVMIFDEVEDVFPQGGLFSRGSAVAGKSWVNKQLEENKTPCFWLTNNVDSIDPAHIRRFDMVIELKIPPKKKRADIIRKYTGGLKLSESAVNLLAEQKYLSPAIIERNAKVSKLLSNSAQQQEKCFVGLIANSLKGMRLYNEKKPRIKKAKSLIKYDISLVNTDKDLDKLIEGISQSKNARLCFYGVPGTGKTALASYIAKQLEMPLLVKRASDIISKWVGETEQNIANMFEEAREKKALLVLDEADSFLRERGLANNSWEVTQVNELLTQMEIYDGLFICTTNLMDNLDAAALRRFDLKLEFNYLLPNQAWKIFSQLAQSQGYKAKEFKKHMPDLKSTQQLTPGDFSLLARQYRFSKTRCVEQIVADLKQEQALKSRGASNHIGFLTEI